MRQTSDLIRMGERLDQSDTTTADNLAMIQ